MPRFEYKALAADGEIVDGVMDAPDRQTVIAHIQDAGQHPIRAEEVRDSAVVAARLSLPGFASRQVSGHDVGVFTRQLHTMLSAGVPLDNALRTMLTVLPAGPTRIMIERIRDKVHAGAALSEALAGQGRTFSHFYINMIKAGELAGTLDVVTGRLADHIEKSRALRETVLSAMIYPAILVVVAALSLVVLMNFVVPQFVPLFEDMGGQLPTSTRIVIGIADFQRHYGLPIVLLLVVAFLIGRHQLQRPAIRAAVDGLLLRLPLVGDLVTKVEVARFGRTMGTLLSNGIPMLTAMTVSKETTSNLMIRRSIDEASQKLEQGQGLAQPLTSSRMFPPLAVQLIRIGEETGQMGAMLLRLADVYDGEVRDAVQRMLKLLEPTLILIMGSVISAIILSILVAILGMNDLVG